MSDFRQFVFWPQCSLKTQLNNLIIQNTIMICDSLLPPLPSYPKFDMAQTERACLRLLQTNVSTSITDEDKTGKEGYESGERLCNTLQM